MIQDKEIIGEKLPSILAVLVNYGHEQIDYLNTVIIELKSFTKYNVTVIVNSNIDLYINGIDQINIFKLEDYQLLPLTSREVIWNNKDMYDIFLYGENDHLFKEKHIDRHLSYTKILPKNRISGLMQYEEDYTGKYYPAYHADFEWDFNSIEIYGGKKFAHFSNLHQATFILTKEQLKRVGKKINFKELVNDQNYKYFKIIKKGYKKIFGHKFQTINMYSNKCKVNTDIFKFGGMKKMICISDFEDNLIHHLPNVYINGLKGRNKLNSDEKKMKDSLEKLMKSR